VKSEYGGDAEAGGWMLFLFARLAILHLAFRRAVRRQLAQVAEVAEVAAVKGQLQRLAGRKGQRLV